MAKTTFWDVIEKTIEKVGTPLSAKEMADYIYDFSLNGNKYFNGKVLQVSSSTP